jgi:hypothetical protein
MHKTKVKPLNTLVIGTQDVVFPPFFGHSVLPPVPDFVAPDVECSHQIEQHDIEAANTQQNLIPTAVQWLIVMTVNVRQNDIARWYEHIVKGREHCACTNRV